MKRILIFIVALIIFALPIMASDMTQYVDVPMKPLEFTYEGTTIPYRLYVPADYSAENKYPVIVFLHGAGERGTDNTNQLSNAIGTLFNREDGLIRQSIVIVPQCPEDNQWVDTPWVLGNYGTDDVPESNELATVVELVKQIGSEYSTDTDRIYAMGLSMGGFGAWDLIIRHNDMFAAAVPICGGGDTSKAELLKDTPIFTFHGTDDAAVPYTGTKDMVDAIKAVGGKSIKFVSYDRADHGIWEFAAADEALMPWLFEQTLSARNEVESSEVVTDTTPLEPDTDAPEESVSETAARTDNLSEQIGNNSNSNNNQTTIIIIIAVAALVVVAAAVVIAVVLKKK